MLNLSVNSSVFPFDWLHDKKFNTGKMASRERQKIYTNMMIQVFVDLLKFEGLPESINTDMLNTFLLYNGHCVITEYNGGLIACMGAFIPPLDVYGIGTKYRCKTLNGESFDRTIGVDAVLFKNNATMTNDIENISRFAGLFGQVDNSIVLNVKNSRYSPILRTSNNKIKSAIEEIIEKQIDGEFKTFIGSGVNEFIDNYKDVEILDITDVKNSDKIQYLSKLHDDLLRRLYNWYGFSMNTTSKMAQQTETEITQNEDLSKLYPVHRLERAKNSIEELNKMFNISASVRFGTCWEVTQEEPKDQESQEENEEGGVDDEENNVE